MWSDTRQCKPFEDLTDSIQVRNRPVIRWVGGVETEFLTRDVTCAVLNFCETVEWTNDKIARCAVTCANVPLHDLTSDVEMKSNGDDLDGIDGHSRATSVSRAGSN